MNLQIYPKHLEDTLKSTWIVRMLKFVGVVQVLGCVALGAFVGAPFLALWLSQAGLMTLEAASLSSLLLGGGLGLLVGLFASLTTWALAQALDDLHALRIQTRAFIAFESDHVTMGH